MWQVAQRSISTVTPLNEHKRPAGTSVRQRTVPREHIDISLIQLFILLDTGYSSSFQNDAPIKNTSKRKNKPSITVTL